MSRAAKKERLVDTQSHHTILTLSRVARYGLRNFTRNAWLTIAATAVMVITLLIIFITVVASSVLGEAITSQKQKIDLSLYIKANASEDVLRTLAGKLRIQPNVTEVSISTSENEYKKASKDNVEGWSLVVDEGIKPAIPAVIHVKLADMSKRKAIEKFISGDPQFKQWVDSSVANSQDVEARQQTINKLSSLMDVASRVGIVAGSFFVVISVLIIFNTIRMTIFSRRDEISMMKSIGADSYFIRGPFLIEAELYGVIAAIIAMVVGYLLSTKLLPSLGGYIEVKQTKSFILHWWWLILLGMITTGFVIGDLSARLALRKYLKKASR
mgnify:FL=1